MLHARHQRYLWLFGPAILALFLNSAWGQRIVIPRNLGNNRPGSESTQSGTAFVTSREMTQRLRTAKQRIAEEDYLTGIRYLQSLLDEREDWFIEESRAGEPGKNDPPKTLERKPNFRSLKNAVEDVVGHLPADARRVYEQEYGIAAQGMLKEAVASGDASALSELARRFFHTEAGYEAVYRLGLAKADHGEPFAAALHFGRLTAHPEAAKRYEPMLSLKLAMCWEQAGLPAQSLAVLRSLKKSAPNRELRIGDRTVRLFERDGEAGPWLAQVLGQNAIRPAFQAEQWPVFRGSVSRNASSAAASPIGPVAWSQSTIQEDSAFGLTRGQLARVENELNRLAEARDEDSQLFPLSVAEPLILGQRAVFRTLQNIQAVDLKTGETLWKTAHTDARLRPVLSHSSSQQIEEQLLRGRRVLPNGNMNASDQKSALENFLTQRIWRDATFGLLSGDSQRVYSVEDVGLADGMYFAQPNPSDPFLPQTYNKLMAFGVQSGQAQWEAGGAATGQKDPLAGTFFLGPPLPIGEQLFCLGERNNEISLLVLDASTGKLEWEQRLVLPALGLLANRERRVMGLSPTFGQGVMICPTASGAVVAVDVTRRMLLWAYEYESTATEDYLVANMAWQRGGALEFSHESLHPEARWADSVPVVAEGKVLITPSDSQAIHCLDLSTGEVKWIAERGQGIYLAGVHEGSAIVVSRSQVRALRLADGKDVWATPVSIPTPAGRGFLADGRFHLPLLTGEVGTIDLRQGRLIARSHWPDGQTPGNLVSAGGRVLFQSVDSIGAFSSWDQMTAEIAAQLKADPNDAGALTLRGRLRLHQGQEAEALADLRSAWKIQPAEETRALLVSRMLEGLRTDPAKYRPFREELRGMIRSSEETLQFLMVAGAGEQTAEARSQAVRDSVELAGILAGKPELVKISDSHHVRGDAWVKARFEQLTANAQKDELAAWDRIFAKELPATLKDLSPEEQWQVLSGFPGLPSVEKAERELISELGNDGDLLARAIFLERLRKSDNEKTRSQATLALVEAYLNAGREGEAYPLIQELGKKWPEAWREEFAALKAPGVPQWPAKKFEAKLNIRGVAVAPEVPIKMIPVHPSPYENWSFSIDQQSQRLVARDENGGLGWHLELAEAGGPILRLDDITLSLAGHVGILSFKTHFAVLDLLSRKHAARILWTKPLVDGGVNMDEVFRLEQFQRNRRFGGGPAVVGSHFGWVTLISEELVVYQVGERITAADAATGEARWTRDSVRRQSRIFGDERQLVVVAPDASSAFLARSADGQVLRIVDLPDPEEQLAFQGTNLISWAADGDRHILESRDLSGQKSLWKHEFPAGTLLRNIGHDEVAAFLPGGRLLIVSLADGSKKVDAKLDQDKQPARHEVCRFGNCYLVLSSRDNPPAKAQNPFLISPDTIPVDGPVLAFDRKTGKLLWKTEVEDQSLEKLPPHNSPVIIFNKRQLPGNVRGFGTAYRLQILDLRTGERIFEHKQLQNASSLGIRVHPQEKKVTVTFYDGEIELELSKEPLESSRT